MFRSFARAKTAYLRQCLVKPAAVASEKRTAAFVGKQRRFLKSDGDQTHGKCVRRRESDLWQCGVPLRSSAQRSPRVLGGFWSVSSLAIGCFLGLPLTLVLPASVVAALTGPWHCVFRCRWRSTGIAAGGEDGGERKQ